MPHLPFLEDVPILGENVIDMSGTDRTPVPDSNTELDSLVPSLHLDLAYLPTKILYMRGEGDPDEALGLRMSLQTC